MAHDGKDNYLAWIIVKLPVAGFDLHHMHIHQEKI
jgi:hypothetical protein